jgi:acyl-CoA dehydrogenase
MYATELVAPFERLIEDICTPAALRAAERRSDASEIWASLEESGFLDALVPESAGGAGLSLADIFPLVMVLGASAVPLPVAETMVARWLISQSDVEVPRGAILLATREVAGSVVALGGLVADHVLWDMGDQLMLAAVADCAPVATGVHNSLAARLSAHNDIASQILKRPEGGLRLISALLTSALIAGALHKILTMTVDYANQRVQFGKPIGRQQALQQNLAVMAEQCVAARLAAELGFGRGLTPAPLAVANAKLMTSAAATYVSATAHAIHGAIGISAEYDLQLFTRRLHEWRMADGAESYWAERIGAARLSADSGSIDFVRAAFFGETALT